MTDHLRIRTWFVKSLAPRGTGVRVYDAANIDELLAAKDAEIARLRAQVEQDAHLRSVVELYRSDPMAMADAIVRLREDVGVLRATQD